MKNEIYELKFQMMLPIIDFYNLVDPVINLQYTEWYHQYCHDNYN